MANKASFVRKPTKSSISRQRTSPPSRKQKQANARPAAPKKPNERNDSEWVEPYTHDDPLAGLPDLAREGPTSLIIVHGAFTALHVISELRSRFELGTLTRDDKHMLAQLGREIAEELEGEV